MNVESPLVQLAQQSTFPTLAMERLTMSKWAKQSATQQQSAQSPKVEQAQPNNRKLCLLIVEQQLPVWTILPKQKDSKAGTLLPLPSPITFDTLLPTMPSLPLLPPLLPTRHDDIVVKHMEWVYDAKEFETVAQKWCSDKNDGQLLVETTCFLLDTSCSPVSVLLTKSSFPFK